LQEDSILDNEFPKEKQVLSRRETAAYLGIHTNTLDRNNDIPRIHIAGRVLFRKKVLDKYLTDLENAPKPRGRPRCGK
jgi:hypothetical protein